MSAQGDNLGAQIKGAIASASRDKRFHSRLSFIELDQANVEIWLQSGSERVSADAIAGGRFIELGVDGVEINFGDKSAYFKPSVATTSGKRTIDALMSSLCHKAGLAMDAWKDQEATILRTKWISISDGSTGLVSPHVLSMSNIDNGTILRWLHDSVHFLINSRQAFGDFTYLYDPIKDIEIIRSENRVRSAGCLYSLSCFYDSPHCLPSDISFENGLMAIASAQAGRTIEWEGHGRVVPEPKSADLPKMGATALLALALGGERLLQHFKNPYDGLFESVTRAQMASGRFQTHLGSDVENMRSSEFFSGQALLTLVQRAERGVCEAVDRCATGFAAYRHQFLTNPTSAFVGWHVDVWSRMAQLTKRSEYAEFAFHQADWLLKMQIHSAPEATWIGGFSASDQMPKYSSVVFLEAIAKAYILAKYVGDSERIEQYRFAVQLGIRFCERLRISDNQMAWFPNPQRSRGGVALSPLDKRVRCDVSQHFITLCLTLLQAEDIV
jgi:hypothetical protein